MVSLALQLFGTFVSPWCGSGGWRMSGFLTSDGFSALGLKDACNNRKKSAEEKEARIRGPRRTSRLRPAEERSKSPFPRLTMPSDL